MDDSSPSLSNLPPSDDTPYAWLDEWLCEYVDGTMDPALEAVFEEYLRANPELSAHVERLKETRELLCACGRQSSAECPSDTQAEVCGLVEGKMLRANASLSQFVQERPALIAGLTSSVVALLLGLFTGALLFTPDRTAPSLTSDAPTVQTSPRVDRAPVATPRRSSPSAMSPSAMSPGAAPLSDRTDTLAAPLLLPVDQP
mgnify:CR=1 FL=1